MCVYVCRRSFLCLRTANILFLIEICSGTNGAGPAKGSDINTTALKKKKN